MRGFKKYDSESKVTAELNKLAQEIIAFAYNATEEQKNALLPLLKDAKILGLLGAWRRTDRRKSPRKPCSLTMYYTVEDKVLKGTIQDISAGGVFMDSFAPVRIGQEIVMTFWPANHEEPMEVSGEIVRIAPQGIGVKFTSPPGEDLKKMIDSL